MESEDSLDRLVREAQESAGEPETEESVDVDAIMNQLTTRSTLAKEPVECKVTSKDSLDVEASHDLKELPLQVRDLVISDMAKKHLGISEEESPLSRSRIDSIFTTIGSSFEDPDTEEGTDISATIL